jgi:DNA-binding CsgD family transcriptional regulator
MNSKLEGLYKEYNDLLDCIRFREEDLDYSILPQRLELLEKLNVIESSSISIFDLNKRRHLYYSSGFKNQLGWDIDQAHTEGSSYVDSRIHPDDLEKLLKAGNYFIRLGLFQMKDIVWKNFKLICDFRIKNSRNDYVRVIEQHLCLETDQSGNYWLDLSILDLNPTQDLITPFQCRLLNFKTGQLYKFPPHDYVLPEIPELSLREKEILIHIAGGLVSKQIADKLFISVNTVNTHRQRIIEKLNVANTAEAIHYASEVGWL